MKIALDPHMHRHLPLPELCRKTAELGFEYIELSPRDDFTPFFLREEVTPHPCTRRTSQI